MTAAAPFTAEEIAELRRANDAREPGDWHLVPDPGATCEHCGEEERREAALIQNQRGAGIALVLKSDRDEANGRAIAAAVNALPRLLDTIEAQAKELAAEREKVKAWREWYAAKSAYESNFTVQTSAALKAAWARVVEIDPEAEK